MNPWMTKKLTQLTQRLNMLQQLMMIIYLNLSYAWKTILAPVHFLTLKLAHLEMNRTIQPHRYNIELRTLVQHSELENLKIKTLKIKI